MQDLDQQGDTAGLSHGDAAVLGAGQGQQSPGHLLLISVSQHGEQPEHHLHLGGQMSTTFLIHRFIAIIILLSFVVLLEKLQYLRTILPL